MLRPATYNTGASPVLTAEEEAMSGELLIFAPNRGFAVGKDS